MKSASISEIKKELNSLDKTDLLDFCLRLSKYKKENKELLGYLLFDSQDEQGYIKSIKSEVDLQFTAINRYKVHWTKKGLRKILKYISKYIKYSGKKQTEVELLIYYCSKIRQSGISLSGNTVLQNLFNQQIKKIRKVVETLHEDLRYDYEKDLESIEQ